MVSHARERRIVAGYIDRLADPHAGHPALESAASAAATSRRSIFAKWLHADCRILLVDEPTRGVDVGAKREIWQLARRPGRERRGHRDGVVGAARDPRRERPVIVMREGRVTAELTRAEATEERIMHHATRHEAGRRLTRAARSPPCSAAGSSASWRTSSTGRISS